MQTELQAPSEAPAVVEALPNEEERVFIRHFEAALRGSGDQRAMTLGMQRAVIGVADLVRTHTILRVIQAMQLKGRSAREFTLDVLLQQISAEQAEFLVERALSD